MIGESYSITSFVILLHIQFWVRFWYENGHDDLTRFSLAQLQEIRGTSLSALLCRNCDKPGKVPREALSRNEARNPMVHCSKLRHLDLSHWREQHSDDSVVTPRNASNVFNNK